MAKRSRTSTMRILRELYRARSDTITIQPRETGYHIWDVVMAPPPDTPYTSPLELTVTFPTTYPTLPPTIVFKKAVFHPNVSPTGGICLNLLKEDWKAKIGISPLLEAIRALLASPNTSDPYNPEAARLYESDREQYNSKAAM